MGRRKVLVVLTVVALALSGTFAVYKLANARTVAIAGDIVARVDTDERVVALTFDDGPNPDALDEILSVLREEGVVATFFLIGSQVVAHPASAQALMSAGHQLANHSFTHQRMWFHTPGWYGDELDRTNSALRGIGYRGPLRFRPPYGKKLVGLPLALSSRDMTTVMWDVDPLDVGASTRGAITGYVTGRARPGSIVLLHPWYSQSVRASIRPVIQRLKADRYRFITVDQLLALR
ncbi:polysaccharide deacetylase family protein [Tsukamurella sp. 8F]|uniref:polysaccharide deacetylase family protein n=1 Tax=unclassified Tsukamurella TaxID=2633480 RepID=UPI0023B94C37|nr:MULTISPECIES: polysaccharide deacetylase family protein [unclassified Tsukamurella]MDF0528850.1 polysaccharide deacetylase family protein [Tsukamurella sp. 8J]MDF0586685.1 polysaccharide deacetylase family protein [Tsukamurella sp. 8F]